MLKQRKKTEILIYPKLFNVLSFYSKGFYSLQISVVQQSIDGKLTYATPEIIQKKIQKIAESKKSYVDINKEKKEVSFVSEQFYITYNEENVALNSLAIFHLQYEQSYHTKTYIDFKLNINRYKSEQGGTIQVDLSSSQSLNKIKSSNEQQKKKVVTKVDSRRIYINNLWQLDQFKRITFTECQYFSTLDTYIGSCYLGTRFRLQRYQLSDFHYLQNKQKVDFQILNGQEKSKLSEVDKGALLSKCTGLSVTEFRVRFNSQLHKSYTIIRTRLQSYLRYFQEQNLLGELRQQIKSIIKSQIHIQTGLKSKQQLSKLYETELSELLYLQIYKQMVQFDQYLNYLWRLQIQLIQNLTFKYFQSRVQRQIVRDNQEKEKSMIIKMKIQTQSRKSQHFNFLKRRNQILSNMKIYEQEDAYHPFIMLQNFQEISQTVNKNVDVTSLVVFIHGYQGSDYDLQKAKNFLQLYSPYSYGLLIKSIQDQIDENIELLGQRVAQQIKSHISGSVNNYKKISILGYSLGGIIARQALKHLHEFKDKMNLLVTFASPHLGVSVNDNKLVGTGIWYLINFEKVKNLKQLNCQKTGHQDDEDITTLQKLSNCECLSWMKKIVVVSSLQDNFVPYYSSRISMDIKQSNLQNMAKNILSRVNKIERVEIWFDVEHDIKTFDKILGRRAHIQFLENRIFLDMFFRLYANQF